MLMHQFHSLENALIDQEKEDVPDMIAAYLERSTCEAINVGLQVAS